MKQKKWFGIMPVIAMLALVLVPFTASAAQQSAEGAADVEGLINLVEDLNVQLAGEGLEIGKVEFYNADGAGQTVFFNDRAKQLGSHYVPGDSRRGGFTDISWLTETFQGTANGLSQADTQAAISNAMATWQNVQCSNLPLTQLPDFGVDWGYVQFLIGYGGTPGWLADLTHAGALPGFVFDFIFGPGNGVLGVTFTFTWTGTDINNDGKADTAFSEIYINNAYTWFNDGVTHYDLETVVLHEVGHGLSQGHFGKAFRTGNGKLHFAPRALMNAGYSQVNRVVTGTDNGGHCSIWGSW
ncbi:MAG: hypothetical protein GY940_18805, partial [bacterium]|nr:hypothetical protein [bacterium]